MIVSGLNAFADTAGQQLFSYVKAALGPPTSGQSVYLIHFSKGFRDRKGDFSSAHPPRFDGYNETYWTPYFATQPRQIVNATGWIPAELALWSWLVAIRIDAQSGEKIPPQFVRTQTNRALGIEEYVLTRPATNFQIACWNISFTASGLSLGNPVIPYP